MKSFQFMMVGGILLWSNTLFACPMPADFTIETYFEWMQQQIR